MGRIFNFSAGPATLPLEVLEQARDEMLDWRGLGASAMEVSHRSKAFGELAEQAEADLRELLAIPEDYAVLFLQGGATQQFALVPLNLATSDQTVDYVVTGRWSERAKAEAESVRKVHVVADGAASNYTDIPARAGWKLSADAAYVHYCPNETVGGVEFHEVPETHGVPLVADMSSNILSRPIDVTSFGMIYAGAQKNIGCAGLVLVIIRKDLLQRVGNDVSPILRYISQAEKKSMLNTPPTYPWYVAALVFQWLKRQGGVEKIAEINQRKADKLYSAIDDSGFYSNPIARSCRSRMNVPFFLPDAALDARFLEEAGKAGLSALKGHRAVGGMRASIYNAMPEAGVDALVDFMADFARRHG